MIDDAVLLLLTRTRALSERMRSEIERLATGGMIDEKGAREALAELDRVLEGRAVEAGRRMEGFREALGTGLRELLGLPSKDELRALHERIEKLCAALERKDGRGGGGGGEPPTGAGGA